MAQVIDKQQVHDLIDQLPPEQLPVAATLLHSMLPITIEDEEIGEAEKAAADEADEWLKHNKPIPFEEVLADFDLTVEGSRPTRGPWVKKIAFTSQTRADVPTTRSAHRDADL
jgi:hypothetical protein